MKEDISNSQHVENVITYESAGVDGEFANHIVKEVGKSAEASQTLGVMSNIGGFCALYDLQKSGIDDPILVSGTDGVGTKLKLATRSSRFGSIGQDLVAMCVNDVLCSGAKPLFFLDYLSFSSLERESAVEILHGISEACKLAECALVGGETAQMPGIYQGGDFDIAGFCVGAVSRNSILPIPCSGQEDIIGLFSGGVHSNGFSIVNRLVENMDLYAAAPFHSKHPDLIGELLSPTILYTNVIHKIASAGLVKAVAHITGGGITENLPRVLPENIAAVIRTDSWVTPPVFQWIKDKTRLTDSEMLTTFNCGIGMILVCSSENTSTVTNILDKTEYEYCMLGHTVEKTSSDTMSVIYT